jgi:Terminase small subunit
VAAGYRDTPWARYNASKLAHVPEVAARIDELQTEFSDRSGIHAEYIQRKLLPLIESDPRKLFETTDDGSGNKFERLKTVSALPSGLAAVIQKIRFDPKTGAVTGIDLHNKNETGSTLASFECHFRPVFTFQLF